MSIHTTPTGLFGPGAIAAFESARQVGNTNDPDIQKEWEMSLLEAMFKSKDEAKRKRAEERYAELEAEYGSSPRYQKLALDLADWFVERGDYALAAQSYQNVSRKGDLDREQVMHLLYLAGTYFSRAAKEAQQDKASGSLACGIYIYPKEIIAEPSFLDVYRPFRASKSLSWQVGQNPTARELLQRVSEEFAIPFVWSNDGYKGGVEEFLKKTRIGYVDLAQFHIARSLDDYLKLIFKGTRFQFDHALGVSGGRPTIAPAEIDEFDFEAQERAQVIEIFDPQRDRFRPLLQAYPWKDHFQNKETKSVMMFHVVKKIEQMTGSRGFYADGVSKEDVLAREFESVPGEAGKEKDLTAGDILRRTLAPMELTYRLTRRDLAAERFDQAKDCFNELRKFGSDTRYTEKALFTLATNFANQKDYEKMRLVLREYLKVFDSPVHPHFYDACFWLGWAFENERNYREAVRYYTRAAEESVVIFKREPGRELAPADELRARLSYETLYNLSLPASGQFEAIGLAGTFRDFVRFNTNLELKFDPSAQVIGQTITRPAFSGSSCFDLLYGVLEELGLDFRTENANPQMAASPRCTSATT